jgi:glucokinase-like ROK family protein
MKSQIRTGDQKWVREHNLSILLTCLLEMGSPTSRTQLVKKSGLNKSTVGNLIAQLQSWGLVTDSGTSDPRPGRPATLIDIAPNGGRLIGVEIGVDLISVVLTDLKCNIVWRQTIETNGTTLEQASVLEIAQSLIDTAITQSVGSKVFGIGLGVPGLVDYNTGTLLFAPNLKWSNVPLRDRWMKRFGMLVVVENDAKAAAVGEQMRGVAKQVHDFVYLNAGIGLGSGVVVDGKLYRGAEGFAGAIGHMTIEPNGPLCNCGNRGCWETLIGPRTILKQVRQAASEGRVPRLLALPEVSGDLATIKMQQVLQVAKQGDPVVLQILEQVGCYLGIGIANIIYAFNPSQVILGGMLSLAGPYVLPSAQAEVENRSLAVVRKNVQLTLSALKADACVIGAAALILRDILNNPTEIMNR